MRLSRRLRFSSFVRNAWRHLVAGHKRAPRALAPVFDFGCGGRLVCLAEGPVAQVVRAHA
jgi:hypothetical protein